MSRDAATSLAIDMMYGELRETGEVSARGLGARVPTTVGEWRNEIRARARHDGVEVRTFAAKCGCCCAALMKGWSGDLGPLRLAFEGYEIALDIAVDAERAQKQQWQRFMDVIRAVEC